MPTYTADEERRRQIVINMHEAFSDIDPDALTDLFTDDAIIHIVMLDPIQGRDAVHAMMVRWRNDYPNIHSELRRAFADGEVVLTEWVDHYDWLGKRYDIPIMGVVEFRGDKIKSWRQFLDRIMADMVGGQYPDLPEAQRAHMATQNVDIVRSLYARFGTIDPDELTDLFADDAYIQPVMKDPYQGRDEIRRMFGLWARFGNVETPLRNIVGDDRVVFTEWLDQSDFGGKHYAVPSVGVFEFENSKISAWRLYYDSAAEAATEATGLNARRSAPA